MYACGTAAQCYCHFLVGKMLGVTLTAFIVW